MIVREKAFWSITLFNETGKWRINISLLLICNTTCSDLDISLFRKTLANTQTVRIVIG